jgi:ribosomal protein S18 acetylase RimI-like enzyme
MPLHLSICFVEIVKISDASLKSEVCNRILRNLPNWFAIESAIVSYVMDVKAMDTWVACDEQGPIGFISIQKHFATSAEIHVIGILETHHRRGVGRQLIHDVEKDLREQGVRFLTVKTLGESRSNEHYDRTRMFYLKMGFEPLEEFKTLWEEGNPCLLLIKSLEMD